ncbi:hydroxyacylglutathione hydrolase, mitochondrial [Bemisia tabaci]|nr:PREDICTED: hydroxyacylglutathione hydrolase, mitochondrial-like [Bemisia tabaci]XP_018901541.1 PREDICTED: hydroxyacylglutathione hydrolase, mitochondrial-like [Bemisia tabaci]
MDVTILPALEDNYMYLITDKATKSAAIVDPVNPTLVLEEVAKRGVSLEAVLTTHHHWDHAGGNTQLKESMESLEVYGGDSRVDAVTKIVQDGNSFNIGTLKVKCLFTPCHTTGHICYFVSADSGPPAVFTGDTLFVAGCGRFFEGTPDQMYKALCKVLAGLPDETKVYCGHEYTVTNLKFARTVDPLNQDVINKLSWAEGKRRAHEPTIPSTIADEKKTNPFMRVEDLTKIQHPQESISEKLVIDMMGNIRRQKDSFRG